MNKYVVWFMVKTTKGNNYPCTEVYDNENQAIHRLEELAGQYEDTGINQCVENEKLCEIGDEVEVYES